MRNIADASAVTLGIMSGVAIDPTVLSGLVSAIASVIVAVCVRALDAYIQDRTHRAEMEKLRLVAELEEKRENKNDDSKT